MKQDKKVLLLLLILLFVCGVVGTIAEQITLTSYYPVPSGEFQNVTASNLTLNKLGGVESQLTDGLKVYRYTYGSQTEDYLMLNKYLGEAEILFGNPAASAHSPFALRSFDGTTIADRFYINTSGNVGIGTTAPGAKLQTHNTVAYSFPTPGQTAGTIHLSATDANSITNALTFGGPDGYTNLTEAGIYSSVAFGSGSSLHLATTDDFNAGAKVRVTIDPSGSVGIGTSNPTAKFHVMASNGAAPTMYMTNGVPAPGVNWMGFVSGLTANLQWNQITQAGDMGIIYSNDTTGNINTSHFVIAPWINSVPKGGIRIDGSGNVEIPRLFNKGSAFGWLTSRVWTVIGSVPDSNKCFLSYQTGWEEHWWPFGAGCRFNGNNIEALLVGGDQNGTDGYVICGYLCWN